MTKGTFTDFMSAMKNLESGVNYDMYQNGSLSAQQIISYVGASAWNQYQNGEINWTQLQYHSHNSLGFVGYQVGEPIMIDTGYYRDGVYYLNGASTNTWDGQFTGKNGINSLADLETDKQEAVMMDAFGYNLKVITEGLATNGKTLNDYIGQTMTLNDHGTMTTVTLSFTGIVAASHLSGAWGTLNFLLKGETPHDEYNTSILKYINDFGGYDAYDANTLINSYKNGTGIAMAETMWNRDIDGNGTVSHIAGAQTPGQTTGNGGDTGTHTGGTTQPTTGNGGTDTTSHHDAPTQAHTGSDGTGTEYHVTWNWGQHESINFDAAHDTLDFSTMPAGNYHVWEDGDALVIEVQNNGNHTYTLEHTSFAELDMSNFHALDTAGHAFWDDLLPG